jgi:hypothetical protein
MENKDHRFSPEEELKAENELLKLKLEVEHGLKDMHANLSPETETQWLNHIYEWEQKHATAKSTDIFSFLGKPEFKAADDLDQDETSRELERLQDLMQEHSLRLDFICEYPDPVKYRFITGEFMQCDIEDMQIEGMMHCYIYEEFHPNHAYDLVNYSREHIEKFFSRLWDEEYCVWTFSGQLIYNGSELLKSDYSAKVKQFQEMFGSVELKQLVIQKPDFSTETWLAVVEAIAKAELTLQDGTRQFIETTVTLGYTYSYNLWELNKITFSKPLF